MDIIRDQFPALRREHHGYPVAYFDGPGGTQVPDVVVDRMRDYLLHHNANTHWAYPTSEETDAAIANARVCAGDFSRRVAGGGGLRSEHDDADVPREPGVGA